jgi:hypothetical protein
MFLCLFKARNGTEFHSTYVLYSIVWGERWEVAAQFADISEMVDHCRFVLFRLVIVLHDLRFTASDYHLDIFKVCFWPSLLIFLVINLITKNVIKIIWHFYKQTTEIQYNNLRNIWNNNLMTILQANHWNSI